MKSFFKGLGILIFAVLVGCCLGCFSMAWAEDKPLVVMSVVSPESKADFEAKTEPLIKTQWKDCAVCTIRNISPYSPEGQFVADGISKQVEAAGSSSSFLFLNWNAKMSEENKPLVEVLKKLVQRGGVVIEAAGAAKENEPTLPLNKTVAGQVPGIIIIGELAERERLLAPNFFGPEMLTALKPPKDYMRQGFGPLFFASRLATQWNKKTSQEWLAHFQATKQRVRRLWPSLEDFFK